MAPESPQLGPPVPDRSRLVFACACVLFLAGVGVAALTAVSSMMAFSTVLVGATAWAFGWRAGLFALVLSKFVSFAVMAAAGHTDPPAHPAMVLLPVLITELFVLGLADGLRRHAAKACVQLQELQRQNHALKMVREEIVGLRTLLSVCAWCGSVRDDAGAWQSREEWLAIKHGSTITHGICPACTDKFPLPA